MNTTNKQEPQVIDIAPEFAAQIYEQETLNAKRGKSIFWLVIGMFVAAFICCGVIKLWMN